MIDSDLLCSAAKAAGIDVRRLPNAWPERFDDDQWSPLIDDGDALCLAVNLKLTISFSRDAILPSCSVSWQIGSAVRSLWEPIEEDAGIATRRAIVRAAAEIGKAMS